MTVEDRIRYATAKLRNIIYYRLVVEESMSDTRYRCQFMHILRKYRKQVSGLIDDLPVTDPRRSWFTGLLEIINPKVKSDECKDTIKRLRDYKDNVLFPGENNIDYVIE